MHNQTLAKQNSTGFTLIELMVVIVILSIFAGMMSLSVGSTEARRSKAFYEHLVDSLSYVRLLSNEKMQPMGMSLQTNNQGQVQPVIVMLDNPYAPFSQTSHADETSKNAMELSATIGKPDAALPKWVVDAEIELPNLPKDIELSITSLEQKNSNQGDRTLQPWFEGKDVPQVIWFGTGSAAPVRIEVRRDKRLVGEAIIITADGRVVVGQL